MLLVENKKFPLGWCSVAWYIFITADMWKPRQMRIMFPQLGRETLSVTLETMFRAPQEAEDRRTGAEN